MNSIPHTLSTTLNPCVQTIEKNMATYIPDKMLLPKKKALTADSDWRMPKWEYPYTSNPTHNRPSSPARGCSSLLSISHAYPGTYQEHYASQKGTRQADFALCGK